MSAAAAAAPNRHERRRAATRARLVDAAYRVLGTDGLDASIASITEAADVGFGTFYNHFETREDLLHALAEDVVRRIAEPVHAAVEPLADPAERLTATVRLMLRRLRTESAVGRVFVALEETAEVLRASSGPRTRRQLEAGRDAGRFTFPSTRAALAVVGGGFRGHLRLSVESGAGDADDVAFAAMLLTALGVDAAEAAEVAARPLPAVDDPEAAA